MLRFAISPTEDMEINALRIAMLNYLVAAQREEPFIVRIEDRNKEKNIEGKDTEIMQILEKFALKYHSVFHQSEHLHMHQTLAIKLLEEEKAFVCTCKEEIEPYPGKCYNVDKSEHAKLKESGEPFVIRIKRQKEDSSVDSFLILDKNGISSDNFASACDDILSGVTYIICEEKHLPDIAKQKHSKTQLGYKEETTYRYLPGILDTDDFSLKWLFEEGFIPDAILNYLLLSGNEEVPKEIFTLPEAIEWFNIENISESAVKFDIDKLRFINREHLRMMDDKKLSTLFGFADADIGKLAKLYLEEASTLKELESKIRPIFTPKDFNGKWGEEMRIMEKLIQELPMINSFEQFKSTLMKKSGLEGEHFFKPLHVLLTGAEHGPELSAVYPLIKPYLLEVAS